MPQKIQVIHSLVIKERPGINLATFVVDKEMRVGRQFVESDCIQVLPFLNETVLKSANVIMHL